jgi:hypothetical protein
MHNLRHGGVSGGKSSPEYKAWDSMRQRCSNPNNPSFKNYGARDIAVCDRWLHSFESFFADMGKRPTPQHSIDRIDVNGPYSPENCRWATPIEQQSNTRANRLLTVGGVTQTMTEWSRRSGVPVSAMWRRLVKLGWSDELAVLTPVREKRPEVVELARSAGHASVSAALRATNVHARDFYELVARCEQGDERALDRAGRLLSLPIESIVIALQSVHRCSPT